MNNDLSINSVFGIAVRKLREQKGWSQEKFAEIAGIHRTYVSSIELGKVSVSIEVAEKLSKSLGLRLSQLIKLAEDGKVERGF